jgi:integrase
VSPLTCRSYGHDLLRWFRFLWAVDVGWEQATETEAVPLAGWLRTARNPQRRRRREGGLPPGSVNPNTGKPVPAAGYAPRTIAHNLSVVHGFYAFHLHFGWGPVLNPVPENRAPPTVLRSSLTDRAASAAQTHTAAAKDPGQAAPGHSLPAVGGVVRADALRPGSRAAGLFVSSRARASELLGVHLGDVDWQKGQLWVHLQGQTLSTLESADPGRGPGWSTFSRGRSGGAR